MKFFALRENPISVFFYTAVGGSLKKMYQGFFFQYPLYKTEKNAQMSVTRARNQQEIHIINYDWLIDWLIDWLTERLQKVRVIRRLRYLYLSVCDSSIALANRKDDISIVEPYKTK